MDAYILIAPAGLFDFDTDRPRRIGSDDKISLFYRKLYRIFFSFLDKEILERPALLRLLRSIVKEGFPDILIG